MLAAAPKEKMANLSVVWQSLCTGRRMHDHMRSQGPNHPRCFTMHELEMKVLRMHALVKEYDTVGFSLFRYLERHRLQQRRGSARWQGRRSGRHRQRIPLGHRSQRSASGRLSATGPEHP
jgi:hypothetical protein